MAEWDPDADIALVKAVDCHGENNWEEVCKTLCLINGITFPAKLDAKSCEDEYNRLLTVSSPIKDERLESGENIVTDTSHTLTRKLLFKLSACRSDEIKRQLYECEVEYSQTCIDIDSIENGAKDEVLEDMTIDELAIVPNDKESVETVSETESSLKAQDIPEVLDKDNQADDDAAQSSPTTPHPRDHSLTELKEESIVSSTATATRIYSEMDSIDPDSGTEYSDEPERKRLRIDEKYKTWKKTAMLIWNRIADHRAGNAFLKLSKEKRYSEVVKQPMSLDLVKTRIREGATKTTAEFHRDVIHILANAVMFNSEESELYSMAMEMRDYVDSEMRSLLVCTARGDGTRQ
ncbi:hypothetical protein QVD99_005656 [Batrachochytrium dendrobatidis]|nr:hypothetical protein QVD99_005656 [Batrachochytrium dendrobatidis]